MNKNLLTLIILLVIIIILIILSKTILKSKKIKENFKNNIMQDISDVASGVAELSVNPIGGVMSLAKTGLNIFKEVEHGKNGETPNSEDCKQSSGCDTCIWGKTKECVLDSCNKDILSCYKNWDEQFSNQVMQLISDTITQIHGINFLNQLDYNSRNKTFESVLKNITDVNERLVNIKDGLLTTKHFMTNNLEKKRELYIYLVQMETSSILVNLESSLLTLINKYYQTTPSKQDNELLTMKILELKTTIASNSYNIGSQKTGIIFNNDTPIIQIGNSLVLQGLILSLLIGMYNDNLLTIPSLVRTSLNTFKTTFTTGACPFGLPTNNSSVYIKFKDSLSSLLGNEYQNTGNTIDSEVSEDSIPYNIALQGFKDNNYATMQACSRNFTSGNLSIPLKVKEKLAKLNHIKELLNRSQLITQDTEQMKEASQMARDIYFNKETGQWKPAENISTFNPCSPININENTVNYTTNQFSGPGTTSSFFNFEDRTQASELQRKKILHIKESIYKNLFGTDVFFDYTQNYSTPVCPAVNNENNTNVLEWQVSSDQPQECISDPFRNEKMGLKLKGNMQPGKIINNKDIWLENVNNLNNDINNLSSVSHTDNLYKYSSIDSDNTDLWRAGGTMIQKVLQDRDWEISTEKWNSKKNIMDNYSSKYIRENILSYYNQDIYSTSSSSKIIYDNDNKTSQSNFQRIFIPTNNLSQTSNITINNSRPNEQGVARIYNNMYQYKDYTTDNNTTFLPSLANKTIDLFALIFYYSFWSIDELANDSRYVYICCQTETNFNLNDSYSPKTNCLGAHKNSLINKVFYDVKSNLGKTLFMKWSIKRTDDGYYLLYNKESRKYLAWGRSCTVEQDIEVTNILYLIPEDKINGNCNNLSSDQNSKLCYQLRKEASWEIINKSPNKYHIYNYNGDQLWYSSNRFKIITKKSNIDSGKITEPLTEKLGWISCSPNTISNNGERPSWCNSDGERDQCFNSLFVIIPTEPLNITSNFQTDSINISSFNQCTPKGVKLNNSAWFKKIDKEFTTSYADRNNFGDIIEQKPFNQNNNPYQNLFKSYNQNNEIITTLEGGDGYNCGSTNYCRIDREPKNSDQDVDQVIIENEEEFNNQDTSNDIKIDFYNKNKKLSNWKTVQAPLKRFNYICKRADFTAYKIGNTNFKISYASPVNSSIIISDKTNSQDYLIITCWSINPRVISGQDFGLSPRNNYLWWKNGTDVSSIRYTYGKKEDILLKYVLLDNIGSLGEYRENRITILRWLDIYRFINSGFTNFKAKEVYGYDKKY